MKAPRINTLPLLSLAVALFALPVVWGAAEVESERVSVVFVEPENFRDFRDSQFQTEQIVSHLSDEFAAHVTKLAKQYLTAEQRLEVRFTDIDLAGDFEPWQGAGLHDVRIVRDIYSPRMELEFRLLDAAGAVVKEGKRSLSDLGFLWSVSSINRSDALMHDKTLLTDWFRNEFRVAKN